MATIMARLNDLIREEERREREEKKRRERRFRGTNAGLKSRLKSPYNNYIRNYKRAVQDLRREPIGPITKRSHRRYSSQIHFNQQFPFNSTYHNYRPSNSYSNNNKNMRMQAYKNSKLLKNFQTVTGIHPANNGNSLKWRAFKALTPSQRATAVRWHRQPPRKTISLGNQWAGNDMKNANRQRLRNVRSHRSKNNGINSTNPNIPWGGSIIQ